MKVIGAEVIGTGRFKIHHFVEILFIYNFFVYVLLIFKCVYVVGNVFEIGI